MNHRDRLNLLKTHLPILVTRLKENLDKALKHAEKTFCDEEEARIDALAKNPANYTVCARSKSKKERYYSGDELFSIEEKTDAPTMKEFHLWVKKNTVKSVNVNLMELCPALFHVRNELSRNNIYTTTTATQETLKSTNLAEKLSALSDLITDFMSDSSTEAVDFIQALKKIFPS